MFGDVDDGVGDGVIIGIVWNVYGEGLVDFECIDGEVF